VTTATATRKKKKKKTTSKRGKSKKPKWTLVTFKQIEQWRVKLGLSKSGMAEALGVTNSTFHNWQRGTTVPHPNQQTELLTRLNALESNASGGSTSSGGTGKSASKGKGTGRRGGSTTGRGGSGKGGRGSSSNRSSHLGVATPGTQSSPSDVPREDIAAITVAYIQSQGKKAIGADAVIGFVQQLREVL